ncbi:MAG: respiratory nitrate reductase subunit gamma [Proteobacteria bacterium]|nr:respiratory nitrate reductase subunit gamma [Pseudomonadota bacterium]
MSALEHFVFGIYPYVCLTIFFVGSLVRFDREQYTWKSDSSQLLRTGQLRWGSNLFHIGVLGIFFGHVGGLMIPLEFWHLLGVTMPAKQLIAIIGGGSCGVLGIVGGLMLVQRRLGDVRILRNSQPMDIFILVLLMAQLALGLFTIPVSLQHLDGGEMVKLVEWAQHIWTFRSGAADFLADVSILFKLHLFIGLTVFLIFPFTRLVHVWSGFAVVGYLTRAYQLVRAR